MHVAIPLSNYHSCCRVLVLWRPTDFTSTINDVTSCNSRNSYLLSFSKNEENIFFVTSVAADYDYNESRLEITKGSLNKNMPSRHPRFLPTPLFKITTF